MRSPQETKKPQAGLRCGTGEERSSPPDLNLHPPDCIPLDFKSQKAENKEQIFFEKLGPGFPEWLDLGGSGPFRANSIGGMEAVGRVVVRPARRSPGAGGSVPWAEAGDSPIPLSSAGK